MYSVIYVSSATELMPEAELEGILAKARAKNQALGISGLLLYRDGNFMQVLEGPKEAVVGLLSKIETDTRHRGIIRLLQKEVTEREFGEWSMGFKRFNKSDALHGHSDFLHRPLDDDYFRQNPSQAHRLLLSFKESVR